MADKFVCSSCNSEIMSNYLKPGEEALCHKCGSRMRVPGDAKTTADAAVISRVATQTEQVEMPAPIFGKATGVKAWNPKWFHFISALFSFVPAGILWALNYGRFGELERKRTALIIVMLLIVALIMAVAVVEKVPRLVAYLINLGLGVYFWKSQDKKFKAFLSQGGTAASLKVPLIILSSLTVLVVAFAIIEGDRTKAADESADSVDYERWQDLQAQDRFEEAFAVARRLHEMFPGERSAVLALSASYMDFDHYDSAATIIKTYVAKSPNDVDAFSFQEMVLTFVEIDAGNSESALQHIDRYIKLNPYETVAYEIRAEILQNRKPVSRPKVTDADSN